MTPKTDYFHTKLLQKYRNLLFGDIYPNNMRHVDWSYLCTSIVLKLLTLKKLNYKRNTQAST